MLERCRFEQTLTFKQVTVKLTYTEPSPSRPTSIPRPVSPTKHLRPKAKINSSAQSLRKPVKTPRAVSPARSSTLSPTFQPKSRVTVTVPRSTPTTPQTRTSETGRLRSRQSSVTLHHAASVSSFPVNSSPSPDPSDIDGRSSPSPPVRIKSKVSNLAKSSDTLTPSPSVSSSPLNFYPITTASASANPHRYAPRNPPQTSPNYYLPFRPVVDPAFVPLPATHSPPTSALSSRSSASLSRSNVSAESSVSTRTDDQNLRSTLDNLLRYTDSHEDDSAHDLEVDTDDDSQLSQLNVKAEAKSNRKIADLEITNRSLLAINASLESAKHKQAKEIRDLRRKLRESRLILPPHTFRAVKDKDATPSSSDDDSSSSEEDQDEKDQVYGRIKAILETLLKTGQRALDSQPKDFAEGGKGGAKVLSPDELRSYAAAQGDLDMDILPQEDPGEIDPTHIAVPDSESSVDSEDDVEMTFTGPRDTPSPAPIRVA
ncbi:hypothetical protein C0991_011976 [Blastosporella zonata]|nr:hypothetical protein C0991_011976 [Blastosporella zonata]